MIFAILIIVFAILIIIYFFIDHDCKEIFVTVKHDPERLAEINRLLNDYSKDFFAYDYKDVIWNDCPVHVFDKFMSHREYRLSVKQSLLKFEGEIMAYDLRAALKERDKK
jgi:hypothetical protein